MSNPQLLLTNRLKLQGFIVSEHMEVWPEALKELGTLVATGKLKPRETIAQGIESAPEAFLGLLKGKNFGKWTAVPFTMQPAGVAHLFAGMPPEAVKAFGADRVAMSPAFRRAPLHNQAAHFHDYLGRLEHLLADDRPFLLGALPSIADFSAAQSIWFVRRAPPVAAHLAGYRRIDVWYERVAAFGHGTSEKMTSAEAIALASGTKSFAPCRVDAGAGLATGTTVGVHADRLRPGSGGRAPRRPHRRRGGDRARRRACRPRGRALPAHRARSVIRKEAK